MNESTIPTTALPETAKKIILAHLAGIGVIAVLKLGALALPDTVISAFSLPAAHLSSAFLAAPLEVAPGGAIMLNHRAIEIEITSACSGFGFFTLICALIIGFATFRFTPVQWIRDVPVLVLLSVLLTILANSFRMICAVQIRLFTSRWIPDTYDAAIHMSVGMIVFLPALLFFWNLLQRFYEHR